MILALSPKKEIKQIVDMRAKNHSVLCFQPETPGFCAKHPEIAGMKNAGIKGVIEPIYLEDSQDP